MLNPMMGILNQSKMGGLLNQIQPIRTAMQTIRAASNPTAALNQMLANNPNYQQITKLINDNGGDAQKAFYSLANQLGVDPQQIIDALK